MWAWGGQMPRRHAPHAFCVMPSKRNHAIGVKLCQTLRNRCRRLRLRGGIATSSHALRPRGGRAHVGDVRQWWILSPFQGFTRLGNVTGVALRCTPACVLPGLRPSPGYDRLRPARASSANLSILDAELKLQEFRFTPFAQ